jgi:hypothetical protein
MAETNNIYQIGIQPDSYTDYATRIIIAPDEDTALAMWRFATDKHHFRYLEDANHIHIKDLGPGPVSKVFEVTTG